MKLIFTAADPMLVGHLRAVLEAENIGVLVKNEHLTGGIGDLPAIECWPELWVTKDADAARAERLVEELLASAESAVAAGEPWQCPECGETLEAQFTECWRCSDGSLLA